MSDTAAGPCVMHEMSGVYPINASDGGDPAHQNQPVAARDRVDLFEEQDVALSTDDSGDEAIDFTFGNTSVLTEKNTKDSDTAEEARVFRASALAAIEEEVAASASLSRVVVIPNSTFNPRHGPPMDEHNMMDGEPSIDNDNHCISAQAQVYSSSVKKRIHECMNAMMSAVTESPVKAVQECVSSLLDELSVDTSHDVIGPLSTSSSTSAPSPALVVPRDLIAKFEMDPLWTSDFEARKKLWISILQDHPHWSTELEETNYALMDIEGNLWLDKVHELEDEEKAPSDDENEDGDGAAKRAQQDKYAGELKWAVAMTALTNQSSRDERLRELFQYFSEMAVEDMPESSIREVDIEYAMGCLNISEQRNTKKKGGGTMDVDTDDESVAGDDEKDQYDTVKWTGSKWTDTMTNWAVLPALMENSGATTPVVSIHTDDDGAFADVDDASRGPMSNMSSLSKSSGERENENRAVGEKRVSIETEKDTAPAIDPLDELDIMQPMVAIESDEELDLFDVQPAKNVSAPSSEKRPANALSGPGDFASMMRRMGHQDFQNTPIPAKRNRLDDSVLKDGNELNVVTLSDSDDDMDLQQPKKQTHPVTTLHKEDIDDNTDTAAEMIPSDETAEKERKAKEAVEAAKQDSERKMSMEIAKQARLREADEAKKKVEAEKAKKKAEAEEAKKKAEAEEAKKKVEEETKKKVEEAKKKAEEEEAKKKVEAEEAKKKAEAEEAKKKAEAEEAKKKAEAKEAKKKAEAKEAKKKAEEETKKKVEEAKKKAEEEMKKAAETAKQNVEKKKAMELARQVRVREAREAEEKKKSAMKETKKAEEEKKATVNNPPTSSSMIAIPNLMAVLKKDEKAASSGAKPSISLGDIYSAPPPLPPIAAARIAPPVPIPTMTPGTGNKAFTLSSRAHDTRKRRGSDIYGSSRKRARLTFDRKTGHRYSNTEVVKWSLPANCSTQFTVDVVRASGYDRRLVNPAHRNYYTQPLLRERSHQKHIWQEDITDNVLKKLKYPCGPVEGVFWPVFQPTDGIFNMKDGSVYNLNNPNTEAEKEFEEYNWEAADVLNQMVPLTQHSFRIRHELMTDPVNMKQSHAARFSQAYQSSVRDRPPPRFAGRTGYMKFHPKEDTKEMARQRQAELDLLEKGRLHDYRSLKKERERERERERDRNRRGYETATRKKTIRDCVDEGRMDKFSSRNWDTKTACPLEWRIVKDHMIPCNDRREYLCQFVNYANQSYTERRMKIHAADIPRQRRRELDRHWERTAFRVAQLMAFGCTFPNFKRGQNKDLFEAKSGYLSNEQSKQMKERRELLEEAVRTGKPISNVDLCSMCTLRDFEHSHWTLIYDTLAMQFKKFPCLSVVVSSVGKNSGRLMDAIHSAFVEFVKPYTVRPLYFRTFERLAQNHLRTKKKRAKVKRRLRRQRKMVRHQQRGVNRDRDRYSQRSHVMMHTPSSHRDRPDVYTAALSGISPSCFGIPPALDPFNVQPYAYAGGGGDRHSDGWNGYGRGGDYRGGPGNGYDRGSDYGGGPGNGYGRRGDYGGGPGPGSGFGGHRGGSGSRDFHDDGRGWRGDGFGGRDGARAWDGFGRDGHGPRGRDGRGGAGGWRNDGYGRGGRGGSGYHGGGGGRARGYAYRR